MKTWLKTLASAGLIVSVPLALWAAQAPLFSPSVGTVSGLDLTNNYNSAFNSMATCNSGATAPTNTISGVPVAGMCWLDTSQTLPALKRYDGTSWVNTGQIDTANHMWTPPIGGGMAGSLASAATVDLGSVPNAYITVTGAVGITSFGSSAATGTIKVLTFSSTPTVTHNGTSLILPGSANVTAATGDVWQAIYLGAGNWRVISITAASTFWNWKTYTPTITPGAGAITTYTSTGRYGQTGKTIHVSVRFSITNNGTGSGSVLFTLPVTPATDATFAGTTPASFYGRETNVTGKAVLCQITAANLAQCTFYDNTYPGGAGANQLSLSGTYDVP